MTFKDYINKRPERADVQGDFIRLAKTNSDLPEVTSWSELKAHMARSGAPPHVVDAGERVWANYLTSLKDAERQRWRTARQSRNEGPPRPGLPRSPS